MDKSLFVVRHGKPSRFFIFIYVFHGYKLKEALSDKVKS